MKIKLLSPTAQLPTRGSRAAAGLDLYADENAMLLPAEMQMVKTGVAVEIPDGYFGALFPRSGLATKKGLRLANCVGVIDSDYRGEIKVAIFNDSLVEQWVNLGDRIAQLVIIPYKQEELELAEELTETERGEGGFGSTGIN